MGLYNIKTELEDLSMKYLEPEAYRDIARKLAETKRERSRYINEFIKPIKEKLQAADFDFDIYGRPKSIHSIWTKIKRRLWLLKRYMIFCHQGYTKLLTRKKKRRMLESVFAYHRRIHALPGKVARLAKQSQE